MNASKYDDDSTPFLATAKLLHTHTGKFMKYVSQTNLLVCTMHNVQVHTRMKAQNKEEERNA